MSQRVVPSFPGSGTHPRASLPAGQRPPPPNWLLIIVRLVFLLCLALMLARGPALRWAATQPIISLMALNGTPAASAPHGLARIPAFIAAIARLILLPPGQI